MTNNVVISTMPGPDATVPARRRPPITTPPARGNGDINRQRCDRLDRVRRCRPRLRLNAFGDVNINAAITATNGNFVACCGRDVNVNAAITTTNGSILLNAGHDVNVFHALTATDGNIRLCAGHDVHIDDAITLTARHHDPGAEPWPCRLAC